MDTKVQSSKDQQINQILEEYGEKTDQVIRNMIGVLIQAHKKVDEASYREWRNKLLTK